MDRVSDLHQPDMIFLPGTKSTIADLLWLRESGLEAAVKKASASGVPVFGICGGYQMLGKQISDPEHTEASGTDVCRGMGLLDTETVFYPEKTQTQTQGTFRGIKGILSGLNGMNYQGYEIHMGRNEDDLPVASGSGDVYGSYIHGIFDAPGISDAVIKALCGKKSVDFGAVNSFDTISYREQQYDQLAAAVRENLDMDFVYRILDREI